MRHLDEGLLQAWLDGSRGGLTDEERTAVAEHLATCPECAVRLEELRETTDQSVDLLGPLEASDEEIPDFEAVVARAHEVGVARAREIGVPRRARRRWVAPAWAASVAVALGVGWLGNEMRRTGVEPAASSEAVADAATDAVAAAPAEELERAEAARREIAPPPEPLVVRGRVVDAGSSRPLGSVQVSFPQLGAGGLTNAAGEFEIPLAALPDTMRRLEMRTELIGYTPVTQALALGNRDTVSSDVRLESTALLLAEVVVTGTADDAAEGRPPATPLPSTWRPVTLDEAAAWAGFPVRSVPGFEVLEIGIAEVGETPVVRVTQRLDGDERLVVFHARRLEGLAELGAPEHGLATLELDDGVWALARAPLPAGEILALLQRIR